ncbi:YihY/virulence factor BrkB family protein [Tepidamorphus sp. 3E244]|uniref:YihY/virulence factor BrkB family protein n=1 Tax=Tepidamorphus sp. 3E244 TaxID=3385498 RepID=UPI0038FC58A8
MAPITDDTGKSDTEGEPETAEEPPPTQSIPDGHGRYARRPLDIPFSGWRDIAWRLYQYSTEHNLSLTAAGVTFYAMLALLPSMVAFVSIYGLMTDVSSIPGQLDTLIGIVPGPALDLMREEMTRIALAERDALSVSFAVSLAISLWSVRNAVVAMIQAMNIAYGEQEARPFLHQLVISLLFAVGAVLFGILAVNVVVIAPVILRFLTLGTIQYVSGITIPLVMALLFNVAASMLYRYGPNRKPAKIKWITSGSLAATLIWIAGSAAFAFYLANWGDYNATYGSLGAVIGLMMWLYITALAIVVGAEINAAIEHQTSIDSTVGRERPMGQRGAYVADTIGRSLDKDENASKDAHASA